MGWETLDVVMRCVCVWGIISFLGFCMLAEDLPDTSDRSGKIACAAIIFFFPAALLLVVIAIMLFPFWFPFVVFYGKGNE